MRNLLLLFVLSILYVIPANAQGGDIRKVNFQEFTYRPSCTESRESVRTREGQFIREEADEKVFFQVNGPEYGDLNGDGREEAVLTSVCNTGGSGNFTEGFVYTMRGGRPVLLTRIEGGDRAFGGIVQAKVDNGLIVLERYAPDESGGGACCPKYVETVRYRWNGRRLVQVGKPARRVYKQ